MRQYKIILLQAHTIAEFWTCFWKWIGCLLGKLLTKHFFITYTEHHWEIIHRNRRMYCNSSDSNVSSHFRNSIIFNDTYVNWALLSKGHVFCPASSDNWPNTIYGVGLRCLVNRMYDKPISCTRFIATKG